MFRLLLGTERCALPLAERLGDRVPEVVRAMATRDSQVVLLREAALAELGGFAAAQGFPLVALKSAAQRARLPSLDLDVLVPPGRLEEMAGFMAGRGYRGTRGYLERRELHRVHIPGRSRAGEMTVEVHHELGDGPPLDQAVWGGLRPHPVLAGCYRLPASRQAWHLLWHSTVSHPHRRGQLGDLLLLREALDDLDDAGRAWLDHEVGTHPAAEVLGRAVAMADGIREGRVPADQFAEVAAAQYAWRSSAMIPRLPARLAKMLEGQVFEMADGGGVRGLWRRLVVADDTPSARPWLYAVQRVLPWVAKPGRLLSRGAVFGVTLPVARRMSRQARLVAKGWTSATG
jgi:hypothetical protein